MPVTKQWPGGSTNPTPTNYSIPLNTELNWTQLSSFLQAIADSAQGTSFQKFAARVATSSPVTVNATSDCIVATNLTVAGAVAVNLPAGAAKQIFVITDSKGDAGTNNITITPNGAETIRGAANLVLNKNYQGVLLVFSGTNWDCLGPFITPGGVTPADFTGILPTTKGGTGVNGTATFPTSGTVATYPIDLTSQVTGTLPAGNGGTGITSLGAGIATFLGTPSSANLASAVTDETGSGSLVFANSPTLVTPALGTPSSATLTNATGLPIDGGTTGTLPVSRGGTGITSLGAGIATFLGTPSSANLASAVTDETGSGSLVFANSPALITPILGVASSTSETITGTAGNGFLALTEQSAAPSTPASGLVRVYAKTDNKLYLKDDLGTETQVGAGGSGEINLIDNPSDATNWGTSGAGILCVTTTTSSDLPLAGVVDTAIKLTPVSGTDYARYRFTMPASLKQTKLKVQWNSRPLSGYTSGDLKVEVYKNAASDYSGLYTEFTLSTDVGGTTSIPNATGRFTTTFDTDDGDYYEVRFVRVGGTTAYNLANLVVGPGIQPQGAVVEAKKTITFTLGSFHPSSTQSFNYNRSGEYMDVVGTIRHGGAATGLSLNMQFPAGLTANYDDWTIGSVGDNQYQVVGSVMGFSSAASKYFNGNICRQITSNTGFQIFGEGATHGNFVDWGNTGPITWAAGDTISVWMRVRINEWIGSGTVQLAQNDVEWAYNTSTSATDDLTSFGYGPAGTDFQNYAPTGVSSVLKRIRFQTPIQDGDRTEIEIRQFGRWIPAANFLMQNSWNDAGTTAYGMRTQFVSGSSTDLDISFFSRPNQQLNWGDFLGGNYKWRVRKSSAGASVGFGLATTTSSGLVGTGVQSFSGEKTFTGRITSGNSKCRAYLTSNTTIPHFTETEIVFNNDSASGLGWDTNGEFNTSNGRFTPTRAGYYLVSANIQMGPLSDGNFGLLTIWRNGLVGNRFALIEDVIGFASDVTLSCSGVIYCNGTTDYISAFVIHNKGSDATLYGGTNSTAINIVEIV